MAAFCCLIYCEIAKVDTFFLSEIFFFAAQSPIAPNPQSPYPLYLVLSPSTATFAQKLIFEPKVLVCFWQVLMKFSELS